MKEENTGLMAEEIFKEKANVTVKHTVICMLIVSLKENCINNKKNRERSLTLALFKAAGEHGMPSWMLEEVVQDSMQTETHSNTISQGSFSTGSGSSSKSSWELM
jgi:hypothetical protein